jgi:hypothetical protein
MEKPREHLQKRRNGKMGRSSPMIGLEKYRQSIKNATEAMPKSAKEEL